MNANELMHGYLDGLLTEEQEQQLNTWLKADPQNAATFANLVRLHDHLQSVVSHKSEVAPPTQSPRPVSRRRWRALAYVVSFAAVAACLVALALEVGVQTPKQVSAATELEQLIDRAVVTTDRTYYVRNLDPTPESVEERRPPIDGAILSVRHPDRYVLVRKFPDGRLFATGCNGERSWSVPPSGAVRVSPDTHRFRGPVPGQQHGIPFADLRSDLLQLREAYNVSSLGQDGNGQRGLLAVKKSSEYRGPNRVELWYDASSGVVQRMVFAGMPKARGGPDRVALELLHENPLPDEFYNHSSHHAQDRKVIEED